MVEIKGHNTQRSSRNLTPPHRAKDSCEHEFMSGRSSRRVYKSSRCPAAWNGFGASTLLLLFAATHRAEPTPGTCLPPTPATPVCMASVEACRADANCSLCLQLTGNMTGVRTMTEYNAFTGQVRDCLRVLSRTCASSHNP